jgi:hypothetical protein
MKLHALWLTKDLEKELGRIGPSIQPDDHVCLRGCLPPDLIIELGGRPGPRTPLAETDPAKVALAKLAADAPTPQPAPASEPERGPVVHHLDDRAGVRVVDAAA